MDSGVNLSWVLVGLIGFIVVFIAWRRARSRSPDDGALAYLKRKIRLWMGTPAQEDLIKLGTRLAGVHQELSSRLAKIESSLSNQGHLEELTIDVRRRLARLETIREDVREGQSGQPVVSGSIQRLGVRMTLTDLIWGELGIVSPGDLSDQQINKVLQGPFCRNCLRSLIISQRDTSNPEARSQCRHCLLTWRWDPHSSTVSVVQLKREIYQGLFEEYRKTGRIGIENSS